MGESIKVNFFFSQPIEKDITYLVRYHLQLCICVTASGGLLASSGRAMSKSWFLNLGLQILSKGQLVDFGRYQARGQLLVSHMLTISKDMLPSFRIVAYYHPSDYEVVSDSVWVEVDESCMGSVRHTHTHTSLVQCSLSRNYPPFAE